MDVLHSDAVSFTATPSPLWITFASLAGLLLGSFLNVCIARLPRHESILWPGSHCPLCHAPIRPWDNIPLLSFLLLRGRCRACHALISWRYPAVEAALSALFLLCALRFSAPTSWLESAILCFLLLGLLVTDAETFLLPDALTLSGIALGFAQLLLTHGLATALDLTGSAPFPLPRWNAFSGSLLGALAAGGFLLLLRWSYRLLRGREGMGLGDVKLAALLGAWLGVAGAALALVLGTLLAAFAGLLLLILHRRSTPGDTTGGTTGDTAGSLRLPFGSFLCLGGFLTLFLGRPLLRWYFHFWV